MKKFFSDFKEFAMKGNIIDMAVGVVIGSAFGKIVSSFVADVITPLISLMTGSVTLTNLKAIMRPAVTDEITGEIVKAEVALTYGNFLQSVIDFLLIALSIFICLRIIMTVKKKAEEAKDKLLKKEKVEEEAKEEEPEEPSEEVKLLTEIRDLLQTKNAD